MDTTGAVEARIGAAEAAQARADQQAGGPRKPARARGGDTGARACSTMGRECGGVVDWW